MKLKYGKALVGALAAVTLSAFAVPFGATAPASTGTTITRNDASSAMQIAQVEQQETEEKTEQKTKEIHGGMEVAPRSSLPRSFPAQSSKSTRRARPPRL